MTYLDLWSSDVASCPLFSCGDERFRSTGLMQASAVTNDAAIKEGVCS